MRFNQKAMSCRNSAVWVCTAVLTASGGGASAQAHLTGTKKLSAEVMAAYGTRYSTHVFKPELEVSITRDGSTGTVVVRDLQYAEKYQCALPATVEGDAVQLKPDTTCSFRLASTSFCVLDGHLCDERRSNLHCKELTTDFGVLTARVSQGSITENSNGTWHLELAVSASGCVLAEGYNSNSPIRVTGGLLKVKTP